MAIDDFSSGLDAQISSLRGAVQQIDSTFGLLETTVKGHLQEVKTATADTTSNVKDLVFQINSFAGSLQKDLSTPLKNAIKNGGDFADVFQKLGSTIEDFILQLGVVNPALNALFGGTRSTLGDAGSLSSSNFSGDTGLVGSLLGGIFSLFEGRASGGPVNAGIPYLVGERGPEMFVPQVAGRIASSPGGAAVSITMNISTPDAASFRASQAQISASMLDAARRAQRIR